MIYTTFNKLHDAGACTDRYRFLAEQLGGINAYGKNTPIPLHHLLELNGLDDALWALRACAPEPDRDKLARLFACNCAERVLPIFEKYYPTDNRPRVAIETARRFAVGEATQEELSAARAAANAAADAARAAANAAADAAWAAANAANAAANAAADAAWAATDAAADAARDATDAADAARDATDAADAAWAAANAAWAAARAAETDWQKQRLTEMLQAES